MFGDTATQEYVVVKPKPAKPLPSDYDSDEAYITNSTTKTEPLVNKFENMNGSGVSQRVIQQLFRQLKIKKPDIKIYA